MVLSLRLPGQAVNNYGYRVTKWERRKHTGSSHLLTAVLTGVPLFDRSVAPDLQPTRPKSFQGGWHQQLLITLRKLVMGPGILYIA